VGGEIKDPQKNLPRALVVGVLAVIAIYLLANLAYLHLLPVSSIRNSPLVAADAAQLILGRVGVGLVAVIVMISTFGSLVGSMLASPRIFFAMADDGLFFKGIAHVHPRFHTPARAIALAAILAAGFVLVRTFEDLSDTFILAIWPFYAMAAAAVVVLRRRQPDRARPVRTLGYPLPPLLFVVAAALILGNSLIPAADNPLVSILGLPVPRNPAIALGVIVSGIPVYYAWMRYRRVA
jgi:amino acid transporter